MSAQAEILIDEREDVVSVPLRALLSLDGTYHVAVRKPDGNIELRKVVLGISGGESIEIKQGLETGEEVVLDPSRLPFRDRSASPLPPAPPAH